MPNLTTESLLIRGLFEKLPPAGAAFPQPARDRWFDAARTIFDLEYGDATLAPSVSLDVLPSSTTSTTSTKSTALIHADPIPQLDVVQGALQKRRSRPAKPAAKKKAVGRPEKKAIKRTKRCIGCNQDKGYRAFANKSDTCNDCAAGASTTTHSKPAQAKPRGAGRIAELQASLRAGTPSADRVALIKRTMDNFKRTCRVCKEEKGFRAFRGKDDVCRQCEEQGEEE